MSTSSLLPLFVNLEGRRVLLVGGGPVAAAKLAQLMAAGAQVSVVAPQLCEAIRKSGEAGGAGEAGSGTITIERRDFEPADLDGAWLVVAAATPEVNRRVSDAAGERRLFVNAVDDPASASAYMGGVVRRDGVTLAISTDGAAPGLTALLRQALDRVLPDDLAAWVATARRQRAAWRREGGPMAARRPLLLRALNELYAESSYSTGQRLEALEDAVTSLERARCGDPSGKRLKSQTARPAPPVSGKPNPADGAVPSTVRTGSVSLVGAGPGDPGLMTRRAVARLRTADLVLYDALIDRRLLRLRAGRSDSSSGSGPGVSRCRSGRSTC